MALESILFGKVVFLGVGNEMKGDDGVGPFISKRIEGINAGTVPENFIQVINGMGPDVLVIFDAIDFGGNGGEIKIIKASESVGLNISTHSLPLARLSEMIDARETWIVGVQPVNIEFGSQLSEEVKLSAERIIDEVLRWKNG